MWTWVKANWERYFLFSVAIIFLIFSISFLFKAEVTGAIAAFVMFFLCLIYGNVSRFKRFKGLGFEAELWEDKQREAADLIERLKNIVQVYTREIVMMRVMAGRLGGGSQWPDRWALFEELVGQHDTLGQNIDFMPLKEKVYRVMVFDAVSRTLTKIHSALSKAHGEASKLVESEFGTQITDPTARDKRRAELKSIKYELPDLFKVSEKENTAAFVLGVVEEAAVALRNKFGIEVDLPAEEMQKLRQIEKLFNDGKFDIDPKLVMWADKDS